MCRVQRGRTVDLNVAQDLLTGRSLRSEIPYFGSWSFKKPRNKPHVSLRDSKHWFCSVTSCRHSQPLNNLSPAPRQLSAPLGPGVEMLAAQRQPVITHVNTSGKCSLVSRSSKGRSLMAIGSAASN